MYQDIFSMPYFCGSNTWEQNIQYKIRSLSKDDWQDIHICYWSFGKQMSQGTIDIVLP